MTDPNAVPNPDAVSAAADTAGIPSGSGMKPQTGDSLPSGTSRWSRFKQSPLLDPLLIAACTVVFFYCLVASSSDAKPLTERIMFSFGFALFPAIPAWLICHALSWHKIQPQRKLVTYLILVMAGFFGTLANGLAMDSKAAAIEARVAEHHQAVVAFYQEYDQAVRDAGGDKLNDLDWLTRDENFTQSRAILHKCRDLANAQPLKMQVILDRYSKAMVTLSGSRSVLEIMFLDMAEKQEMEKVTQFFAGEAEICSLTEELLLFLAKNRGQWAFEEGELVLTEGSTLDQEELERMALALEKSVAKQNAARSK